MFDNKDDIGKFILRAAVAVLLFFHGFAKLKSGVGVIEGKLLLNGLPGFISYGVYIGEILAPFLLLIGYKTKIAAFLVIFTMLNAIFLVHSSDILAFSIHGGLKLELIYFYILASISIICLGAGKFSLDGK